MLIASLFLSAFLLLAANWAVFRDRHPSTQVVCGSLALALGPCFLGCFFPPVALQALLLSLAAIGWRAAHRGPATFLALSCAATLLAYGIVGVGALEAQREYARLRARYPYESMEARLPAPKPASRPAPRSAAALRLARLESAIAGDVNGYRERLLMSLHERAVALFINSPGFGVARLGGPPTEQGLVANLRRGLVPLQPGRTVPSSWSPGAWEKVPADDEAGLGRLYEASVVDFANPLGFGYVKDRRHVAGFESHRFSQVPAPTERWQVRSLDLMGLLLRDEPVVYVSAHLPRMDELRGAPTRPLDDFETFGLDALRRGEDLLITHAGDGARMLGAVRSTRRCLPCHDGNRGDLLGAFSYSLRRDTR